MKKQKAYKGKYECPYCGLSFTDPAFIDCLLCGAVLTKAEAVAFPHAAIGDTDVLKTWVASRDKVKCPKCDSDRVTSANYANRMECKNCGKVFT